MLVSSFMKVPKSINQWVLLTTHPGSAVPRYMSSHHYKRILQPDLISKLKGKFPHWPANNQVLFNKNLRDKYKPSKILGLLQLLLLAWNHPWCDILIFYLHSSRSKPIYILYRNLCHIEPRILLGCMRNSFHSHACPLYLTLKLKSPTRRFQN
jgi:hypothetical protein